MFVIASTGIAKTELRNKNTHPPGTPIPLEYPCPWNSHPPGIPILQELPSPWNTHPPGTKAIKRYVHENYDIIKAFRGEQTLKGRNTVLLTHPHF